MSLEEIQKLKEELYKEELDFDNLMRLNILDRIEQYLEDEEENLVCTFNGNRGVFSFDDLVYEWQQHNLAYNILPDDNSWKEHAKDVDLNPADQGKQ